MTPPIPAQPPFLQMFGQPLSSNAAAAIVSSIEEKEEKEKDEEKEKAQEQTQETTAATATAVRAGTPSIWTAGTLKFATGSPAGGAAPSGVHRTRETQFHKHASAARIGGRLAPMKEELEKAAKNVPIINVPVINVPAGFKLSFGKDQVRFCFLFVFSLV
jgi:hypothetical protein